MNLISDEEIIYSVQSTNKTVRAKVIRDNDLSLDVIKVILQGKYVDTAMQLITSGKMELNDDTFEFIINNKKKKGYDFSIKIWNHVNFKKEWLHDFLTYEYNVENSITLAFKSLEDARFVYTDNEWIELYKFIRILNAADNNDEQTIVNWNTMFYSFFKYPIRNYSVEVILTILEEQGQEIFRSQSVGEIIFKDIFSKQTKINDDVLNKMFEISKDPQYLPTEAKDIFIF